MSNRPEFLLFLLDRSRKKLLHTLENLTVDDLDYKIDPRTNSIGTLLRHIAFIEHYYCIVTFERRTLNSRESEFWNGSITGQLALNKFRRLPIYYYEDILSTVRDRTMKHLETTDASWLERISILSSGLTHFECCYHAMEDEMFHIGQIKMILGHKKNNYDNIGA